MSQALYSASKAGEANSTSTKADDSSAKKDKEAPEDVIDVDGKPA